MNQAIENGKSVIINQGGTSSSKTYTTLQFLFYKCISERGVVVTVMASSVNRLKTGAWRDIKTIINPQDELERQKINDYIKKINETDRIIYFSNGSQMEFIPFLGEEQSKHGKRQYLFVNEANQMPYPIYVQLAIRTQKNSSGCGGIVFLDYNPSAKFWVHNLLVGRSDVAFFISDHRINCFLHEDQHRKIENIGEVDTPIWNVYARGMTGNVTGMVYPDWEMIERFPDDSELEKVFYGIDYGYTNDPTAIVKIGLNNKTLYFDEIYYRTNCDPDMLADIFIDAGCKETVIYSEHDRTIISKLRRRLKEYDVVVLKARKGPNSIRPGIGKVNQYKCYYTQNSLNIINEREQYVYIEDSRSGEYSGTPIDKFNHAMDAIRYGVYSLNV